MDSKYKRISQLENFFSMFLTSAKVSDNVFVGDDLPATISSEWNDMVLADCNSQTDWSSHTSGSVSIFLYARPTGKRQIKNLKTMDKMETALRKAIEAQTDAHYTISCVNWTDHGYDSTRNLHYQVINVQVVVK